MGKIVRNTLLVVKVLILAALCESGQAISCRYLPGDNNWPHAQEWNAFNKTIGGRLVATVPLATVCHGDKFNSTECQRLKQDWLQPLPHEESPSSIMAPYYQNQSCDPFTPQSKPCELGNYVSYSINASTPEDICAGIRFARSRNIRLVIKNTGHDFLGRSTGTGGLGIWTHNLRSQEFIPGYTSSAYNGPALKLGSGTRAFEAIDLGHQNGVQTVTGDCPTIGIVGGYLQGGGSGPLASTKGMAADQVLEYEVITANASVITASPTTNSDLYWALSGGGGGTFGVVVSATLRAFEDGVVGGASFNFSRAGVPTDTVYDIMGTVLDLVPSLIDAGMHFSWAIFKNSFSFGPLTAPGFTAQQVRKALDPLTSKLDGIGIKYDYQATSFPNFRTHFETYLGPLPGGRYGTNGMVGSRLLPRNSLQINRTSIIEATRDITETTSTFISYIGANLTNSATKRPVADNSVLPQWRNAAVLALVTLSWDFEKTQKDMLAEHARMLEYAMPRLRSVLPSDAGTYLNEAEVGISSWKQDFFGSNYDRLRKIKSLYDPSDIFWADYSVGSDAWYLAGDGRLCRKET